MDMFTKLTPHPYTPPPNGNTYIFNVGNYHGKCFVCGKPKSDKIHQVKKNRIPPTPSNGIMSPEQTRPVATTVWQSQS